MTEPKNPSSPRARTAQRSEFVAFHRRTSPALVGELLAVGGDLRLARAAAEAAYGRVWQAWPAVRTSTDPAMWVRADAFRRILTPSHARRLLDDEPSRARAVHLEPADTALVDGLSRVRVERRLPLVLHHMGGVRPRTIAEWFGGSIDAVEDALAAGLDELAAVLAWPRDAPEIDPDAEPEPDPDPEPGPDARRRTAKALADTARRFRAVLPVAPPPKVLRRAPTTRVARHGAPVTAAAICIGLVVWLSPVPTTATDVVAFAVAPTTGSPVGPPDTEASIPIGTVTARSTPVADATPPVVTAVAPTADAGTTAARGTVVPTPPAVPPATPSTAATSVATITPTSASTPTTSTATPDEETSTTPAPATTSTTSSATSTSDDAGTDDAGTDEAGTDEAGTEADGTEEDGTEDVVNEDDSDETESPSETETAPETETETETETGEPVVTSSSEAPPTVTESSGATSGEAEETAVVESEDAAG